MEKYNIDCLIIGGGISGLSIANKIAAYHKEIFLIEKNLRLGEEASSRNSEVIHAGIYYPHDSLKAKFCVEGKILLYEYLEKNKIPFNRCGKFILSTSDEESDKLQELYENARNCGVSDLTFEEPSISEYKFLKYQRSLFSPSTGILDSHTYMSNLEAEYKEKGGTVLRGNEFKSVNIKENGFEIVILDNNNDEEFIVETQKVFNCAGLQASEIANSFYDEKKYKLKAIKGDYYSYLGKEKLKHLIYPMPKENSLGTHATLDLGQGIRFGPSAYEVEHIDYSISVEQKDSFYLSIQNYWPQINKDDLVPDYSGIRACVEEKEDFLIDIGLFKDSYLVNILNYVSPGLTASLALAEYIHKKCNDL
ncbi:MAG: FAD-dependent oxidoreductase [Candidatus Marinimicrobia bacterium]|nr:FAD-dependent oxidoreductase [Candidatus Neomarinimicrobiota bacterium]|tara:strand:- start:69 stop:1160 length:1092 start_codon:yes stop_codon:yes gene_type:complete